MEYINGELERKCEIFKRSREHATALQPCPGIILGIKLREEAI